MPRFIPRPEEEVVDGKMTDEAVNRFNQLSGGVNKIKGARVTDFSEIQGLRWGLEKENRDKPHGRKRKMLEVC